MVSFDPFTLIEALAHEMSSNVSVFRILVKGIAAQSRGLIVSKG